MALDTAISEQTEAVRQQIAELRTIVANQEAEILQRGEAYMAIKARLDSIDTQITELNNSQRMLEGVPA